MSELVAEMCGSQIEGGDGSQWFAPSAESYDTPWVAQGDEHYHGLEVLCVGEAR